MNFQEYVDMSTMPCAILAVDEVESGRCGQIYIVHANDAYKNVMGKDRYYDSMVYSELVPANQNFEDFCYRCAFLKKKIHTYVETPLLKCWTDLTFIPLQDTESEGRRKYCAFFFEFTKTADPELMAEVSIDTAATVIKSCIMLRGSDDFQSSIDAVIADIQKQTDSFSSCIFLLDKKNRSYSVLCEKFRNDEARVADYADQLTYEIVASWERTTWNTDGVIVKNEDDMRFLEQKNPAWVATLRKAEVKSLVLFPLMQGKGPIGFLFITNFNTEQVVQIKELIELMSFFLASEIANNQMMVQLERLSNTDLLTGVKSRNAMNHRVDLFVSGECGVPAPFGALFADLNGLKAMNDNNGHSAGDTLLKNCAMLLCDVFKDDEVYRAGGDEFVIIAPSCKETEFNRKVEELRKRSGYDCPVCLAVGSCWCGNGEDLRLAMHLADEAMYKDKFAFYQAHGGREACNARRCAAACQGIAAAD